MQSKAVAIILLLTTTCFADVSQLQAQIDALMGIAKKEPVKSRLVYNVMTPRRQWTYPYPGRGDERLWLIGHLLAGQHNGKFKRSELEKLNLRDLKSLHSNDHVGKPFVERTVFEAWKARKQLSGVQLLRSKVFCPT